MSFSNQYKFDLKLNVPFIPTLPPPVISTLQLFGAACRVYSPSDVRPVVELGDSLKQEGVVNPLPALMNSSKGKYTGQAAPKSCKVEVMPFTNPSWNINSNMGVGMLNFQPSSPVVSNNFNSMPPKAIVVTSPTSNNFQASRVSSFDFQWQQPFDFAGSINTVRSVFIGEMAKVRETVTGHPSFPLYTQSEKIFFAAFNAFPRWVSEGNFVGSVPPTVGTGALVTSSQSGMSFSNSPIVSIQANLLVRTRQEQGYTAIDISITNATLNIFDPLRGSVNQSLTSEDRNRIVARMQKSQADSIAALNSSISFSMTGKVERPLSRFISVMIGSGNSIQIDFSEHVRNFNQQIQPIRQTYPLSIADFSLGFVKGLPKGVYDSGAGLCAFATSVVQHPLQTGVQVLDALALLRDLACSEQWNALSKTLAPEIHQLVTEWDTIPSSVRGELAGYALGKYGSDIIIPGALAKAVSRGIKGARELNGLYSGLQAVEQNFLQESVGVANSVKIGEIGRISPKTVPISGEFRFTAQEIAEIKQIWNEKAFSGRKGFQLENISYQPVRNTPMEIGGRMYSSHALDQMQNRGLPPSVIENTIKVGEKTPDPKIGRCRYYDRMNNITVVIEQSTGEVVTTIPGRR